jgi:hypothetical protein
MTIGSKRQMAVSMLEFYNQCATNGYHPFDLDLPLSLRERYGDSGPGLDAKTNYAAIGYSYWRLGIYCEMTFYLQQNGSKDSWTLSRCGRFTLPSGLGESPIGWSEQLTTVSNINGA